MAVGTVAALHYSLTGHFESLQLMLVLLVASLLPSAYGMAMSRQAVLAPFAARNAFKLISGTVDRAVTSPMASSPTHILKSDDCRH